LIVSVTTVVAQDDRTERLVRVKGSNAMAGLCDEWGKAFASANPGMSVVVTGGGTDLGFDALFEKGADLVMASRKILEKEIQAATLANCKPGEIEVCRELVTAITHPSNPVNELTLDQLGRIFRGNITNWKDLGGPDELITVITSPQTSGTALFLREKVLGNDYFASDARVRSFYHGIITELSRKKPPAIAYAPYHDAKKAEQAKQVKILGIRTESGSGAVQPSPATLKDASYPLVIPLYLYWDQATTRPAVKKFVDFCRSKCQGS
jgi:phosphate transport system substrate-binding protein